MSQQGKLEARIYRMKKGYRVRDTFKQFPNISAIHAYVDRLVNRLEKRGVIVESGFKHGRGLDGAMWVVINLGDNWWQVEYCGAAN